jgi:hypothetical protein
MVTFKQLLAGLMTAGLILGSLPVMGAGKAANSSVTYRQVCHKPAAGKLPTEQLTAEQQQERAVNSSRPDKKPQIIKPALLWAGYGILFGLLSCMPTTIKPLYRITAASAAGVCAYQSCAYGNERYKLSEKVDPDFTTDGGHNPDTKGIPYKDTLKSEGFFYKGLGYLSAGFASLGFLGALYTYCK